MYEPEFHRYSTGETLAQSLSQRIAAALADTIDSDGQAVIGVSGGSTPKAMLRDLSHQPIDWSSVTVTLVDERFVRPSNERSNQRLVAMHLLQNKAAFARFIPLFRKDLAAAEAAAQAARDINALGKPPDVIVLGMGTDGHTASWFPGSPDLAKLTDPHQTASVLSADAPGQPEMRLSMTLPIIARSKLTILHIEGEDKMKVLEEALETGSTAQLPVRAVLRRTDPPLQIYWAP
ncbi:MAG: 6-phosphogluconolactonase [Pseudomonadota bacterium]